MQPQTSIGSYQGKAIRPGTDAEVAAQVAEIDKGLATTSTTTTSPTGGVPSPFTITTPDKVPSEALAYAGSTQELIAQSQAQEKVLMQQRLDQEKVLAQKEAETLKLMEMTPEEQAAQMELAKANTQMREREAKLNAEVEAIRSRSAGTVSGANAAEVMANRNFQNDKWKINLAQLAASETLKALTGFRESKLDIAKTALGFEDNRLERLLGLEKEFRQETSSLSKEARQNAREDLMNTMNMGLKYGVSFDELDPQAQEDLAQWAQSTPGMSLSMLVKSMEAGKIAYQEERTKAALELQEMRVDIAKKQQELGGGSNGFSSRTSQVLDGFTKLDDLTPTDQAEVRDELYRQGFGADTPPAWFRDYIEEELRMNLGPDGLQSEWIKYRDSVLDGSSGSPTSSGGSGGDALPDPDDY